MPTATSTHEDAPDESASVHEELDKPDDLATVSVAKPDISELTEFLRRTQALVPIAIVGIFLLAAIAFLYLAKAFLLPVFMATVLSFLLKPAVRFLNKLHIHDAAGAALVMVLFATMLSLIGNQLAQPAKDWASNAPEKIRDAGERIRAWLRPAVKISKVADQVEDMAKTKSEAPVPKVEVTGPGLKHMVFQYTKNLIALIVETAVLLYFLLAAGDMFLQKMVKILPTLHDKKKAVEISHQVQQNISTFLFTITGINACLGIAVGVAMHLLGMPSPILWGVIAGLLNFVPYFGPIAGGLVLLAVGSLSFDSMGRAVLPAIIYLGIHVVESNFLTPTILGRRLTLNPVVIFISLIFWTWLWGIPGALLAIPMLMMLKILCDHFKPLAPIAEFLAG